MPRGRGWPQLSITEIPGLQVTAYQSMLSCRHSHALRQWVQGSYAQTLSSNNQMGLFLLQKSQQGPTSCQWARQLDPKKTSGPPMWSETHVPLWLINEAPRAARRRETKRVKQMSQKQGTKQKHQHPHTSPQGYVLPESPFQLPTAIHTTFRPLLCINNSCRWSFC